MKSVSATFCTAARLMLILLLVSSAAVVPARAQVMHNDGLTIPWFHSRAEKLARQACMDDLPECRDSVRQELAVELMITTLAPWVLLCLVILGAVMYVRRNDVQREARRHEAERHHIQAQAGKRSRSARDGDDRRATAERVAEDEDGLGHGHPGERG